MVVIIGSYITMTNDLDNIEQFHKCVAIVLNLMYENFPNPIDIDTFYIEGEDVPSIRRALVNYNDEMESWRKPGNSPERNPVKMEISVYKNSLFFLRDEGYVQTKEPEHGQGQRTFRECRLTAKGLAALGRVGVKEKINWGQLIHSTIRDGKYKALQNLAIKVLSGGMS